MAVLEDRIIGSPTNFEGRPLVTVGRLSRYVNMRNTRGIIHKQAEALKGLKRSLDSEVKNTQKSDDFPDKHLKACEEHSDEQLMDMIVLDDKHAYRILVERYINRTVALAARVVYGAGDAEDIAQDVFLSIWQNRSKWQPEKAAFSTWLHKITINRCIDYNRKMKFVGIDAAPEPKDEAPDAVTKIYASQVSGKIRIAMLKLSEQQQIAMVLYYHEGLTAMNCSEVMDINLNAVESLLKRGRKKLREIFKAQNATEPTLEIAKDISIL